jgi:hypothetical protein
MQGLRMSAGDHWAPEPVAVPSGLLEKCERIAQIDFEREQLVSAVEASTGMPYEKFVADCRAMFAPVS